MTDAPERMTKEELAEMQIIAERDAAGNALTKIYIEVTGRSPEWSSAYDFDDAVMDIETEMASYRKDRAQAYREGQERMRERCAEVAAEWEEAFEKRQTEAPAEHGDAMVFRDIRQLAVEDFDV